MSASTASATPDRPTWDLYSTCIHCGLCLQQCPTYRVLGMEMDSPRGRIYQTLLVDAGRLPIGESYVTHIDRCLDCRACETACPSGVQYGRIVERAPAQIEQNYRRPLLARWLRAYFYRRVLMDFRRLARGARLLRFYQRSGMARLLRASGLLKLFGVAKLEALAPRIEDDFFFRQIGEVFPAEVVAPASRRQVVDASKNAGGTPALQEHTRARVALLAGWHYKRPLSVADSAHHPVLQGHRPEEAGVAVLA